MLFPEAWGYDGTWYDNWAQAFVYTSLATNLGIIVPIPIFVVLGAIISRCDIHFGVRDSPPEFKQNVVLYIFRWILIIQAFVWFLAILFAWALILPIYFS